MTSTDSLGRARGDGVAFWSVATFSDASRAVYLCDAGCRPNPGSQLPVVWDGSNFLKMTRIRGTNHQAAYAAIKAAIRDAINDEPTHVEFRLTSDLVFRQLATGGYCRNAKLEQLRDLVLSLAHDIAPVRLVLVEEPFVLGGIPYPTSGKLRKHALSLRRRRPVDP